MTMLPVADTHNDAQSPGSTAPQAALSGPPVPSDYLPTELNSSTNNEVQWNDSPSVEPSYSQRTTRTTPEAPPDLESLRLRDRSLTPGRKRPAESSSSQPERSQFRHEVFMRTRPKPTKFTPDQDDGIQVYSGTHKHTAYDFDSPIASMSRIRAKRPSPREDAVNPLTLQPKTRQITEEQLINEVRGIYAGLVLVEKKCVEIDQQQAKNKGNLSNDQWQALIALHRTLLHEHHDFFLASQHPSASPALRRLASKYAMPARMWRHGIHSFLEFLRHRLPDSLDHMLAFIYTAYSMMALLLESVPSFEDTWIECLGDLARYRMAVEETDLRDREVWAGVARYWYHKAADKSPRMGRIQHHLAVLARPNILQQLFYYTKSLVCAQPFPNSRDSILLLFNPLLNQESSHHPPIMSFFVKGHGLLFHRLSILSFLQCGHGFLSHLGTHIGRAGAKWREQGVYIASANFAAMLGYGAETSLKPLLQLENDTAKQIATAKEHYSQAAPVASSPTTSPSSFSLPHPDATFTSSPEILFYSSCFAFNTLSSTLKHIGDKNVLPHVHVSLAFLWSLALVPESMKLVQSEVPWQALVAFLNTLNWQGVHESKLRSEDFPLSESSSGTCRHLPEDFLLRGQIWTQLYYPDGFFSSSSLEDEEERALELPSINLPRTERCLWLGHRLASCGRWIGIDDRGKFVATEFAKQLEKKSRHGLVFAQVAKNIEEQREPKCQDVKMTDSDGTATLA